MGACCGKDGGGGGGGFQELNIAELDEIFIEGAKPLDSKLKDLKYKLNYYRYSMHQLTGMEFLKEPSYAKVLQVFMISVATTNAAVPSLDINMDEAPHVKVDESANLTDEQKKVLDLLDELIAFCKATDPSEMTDDVQGLVDKATAAVKDISGLIKSAGDLDVKAKMALPGKAKSNLKKLTGISTDLKTVAEQLAALLAELAELGTALPTFVAGELDGYKTAINEDADNFPGDDEKKNMPLIAEKLSSFGGDRNDDKAKTEYMKNYEDLSPERKMTIVEEVKADDDDKADEAAEEDEPAQEEAAQEEAVDDSTAKDEQALKDISAIESKLQDNLDELKKIEEDDMGEKEQSLQGRFDSSTDDSVTGGRLRETKAKDAGACICCGTK